MTEQAQPKPDEQRSARRRELRETLHAIRTTLLLFAIVIVSPLTGFAYRFSYGTHPRLIQTAFRNALLLVPVAFVAIWLGLLVGERVVASRAMGRERSKDR